MGSLLFKWAPLLLNEPYFAFTRSVCRQISERFCSLNSKGVCGRFNRRVTVSSAPDLKEKIWALLQIWGRIHGFTPPSHMTIDRIRTEKWDIFIPCFSEGQKQSPPPPWVQSVFTVALVKRGTSNVMWICQAPTQTLCYNQCRLCLREKTCAGVCSLYVPVSKGWLPLLKLYGLYKCLSSFASLGPRGWMCWWRRIYTAAALLVSPHSKGHLKSPLIFSRFDLFLPQLLLVLSDLWVLWQLPWQLSVLASLQISATAIFVWGERNNKPRKIP